MNELPSPRGSGSFIVELDGQRIAGLAAHEVTALLEGSDPHEVQIFRIHRTDEHGRVELVGVSPAQFTREEGMIFHRRLDRDARRDFEAIRAAGATTPPPCRLRLELAEAPACDPPYVLMIAYPAACNDAVANWLLAANLMLGDKIDAGSSALEDYRAASPQIIEDLTLG